MKETEVNTELQAFPFHIKGGKMKPTIVIPPDLLDADSIAELRASGFAVVVAADPNKVRFLDPIPTVSSRTEIESSCIQFTRKILNAEYNKTLSRDDLRSIYLECLMRGSPLDERPSKEEREKEVFEIARHDELRKIAREEARTERDLKKKSAEKK